MYPVQSYSFGGVAGGHIRQAQCEGVAPACSAETSAKVDASESSGARRETQTLQIGCGGHRIKTG